MLSLCVHPKKIIYFLSIFLNVIGHVFLVTIPSSTTTQATTPTIETTSDSTSPESETPKSTITAKTKETVERSHGETLYVLKPK